MSSATAVIRAFDPADRAAVYEVCVRTADAGRGLVGELVDDDLPADVYVAPYLAFDPSLALVLARDGRPVGYLVGTTHTGVFADWYETNWIPLIARKYRGVPADSRSTRYVTAGLSVERFRLDDFVARSAHLHMNLLPEAQGHGYGRALLTRFAGVLAVRGVQEIHVTTSAGNPSARHFYEHLGFVPLDVSTRQHLLLAAATAALARKE